MAIDIGDVVRIIDRQTYDGQQVLNVYYYEINATPVSSPDEIAEAWYTQVCSAVRACQVGNVVHTEITIENLDGTLDYGRFVPDVGARHGTSPYTLPMSAFNAYGITLTVSTRQVRPGSKRLVGCSEQSVGEYGVVESNIYPALVAAGLAMSANVTFGLLSAGNMTPVVVGFPHPESPSGRPARLTRVEFPITGYIAQPYVTTQNTRKRGRGA